MIRRVTPRLAGLSLAGIVLGLMAAGQAEAQLRRETVLQGLSAPVGIYQDPVTGAALIVQQNGLILAFAGGAPVTFLDLRGEVEYSGEQGLLGLAFPPDAATTGRVFVSFVKKRNPDGDTGDTVIARYRRSTNPLVLDTVTRKDLVWPGGRLVIEQPYSNHKGGNIVFGPDGFLYIGMGDGGSGNDPQNRAQNPLSLLGKMLRVDINVPDGDPEGYNVPVSNPFVGRTDVLTEIWAFGYRNPWRYSFDDFGAGATGALIVGDVGQGAREEIDYEPAGRGGRNYGWSLLEGTIPTPGVDPNRPRVPIAFTAPIFDVPRSHGTSITGGFVYRGAALPPQYYGRYFFADFGSGRVFSLGLALDGAGEARVTNVLEHTAELGNPSQITTFGRDLAGELYFASFAGGTIYRIGSASSAPPATPANLRAAVSGSTVTLSWDAGVGGGPVLGYQVEAGVQPGQSTTVITQTAATQFVIGGVPPGTYYVKVRSGNAAALNAATPEIPVTVSCPTLPAPTNYVTQIGTLSASLSWNAVAGATGYQVEAGSTQGQADLAVFQVASPALAGPAPARTYYTRVRALNACGAGAASVERVFTIPAP